jgi:hypothetical protein
MLMSVRVSESSESKVAQRQIVSLPVVVRSRTLAVQMELGFRSTRA